jgi:hypothetical protein
MGAPGGYREELLAPDIYRVAFFGNGYTNPQTAAEYLIHRCAELTEQRGYRYFGILAGAPVIAGLLLVIYKIGIDAFCQWSNPIGAEEKQ